MGNISKYNNDEYYRLLDPEKYPEELQLLYQRIRNQELDLENPKKFTEKIQWLKLYDSTPLKTRLADKYLVKDWVKEKIGKKYVVPLLGVWDTFDEIDFDKLPQSFVLKANHGCKYNIAVKDKALLDREAAKYNFNYWLKRNFALESFQLHYADIEPKIIAEEYLDNGGKNLDEYEIYCFGGKAEYIRYMFYVGNKLTGGIYDTKWNRQPFNYNIADMQNDVPRPENLDEILTLSEKLADGFSFARIDFYITLSGEIKFGEITFTPSSGYNAFNPPEYDLILGEKLALPKEKGALPEKSLAERGAEPCPDNFTPKETDYKKIAELYAVLKPQAADLSKKLDKVQKENTELNTKFRESCQNNAELRDKLENSQKEKADLNTRLQQSCQSNARLSQKLENAQKENDELNAKYQQSCQSNAELKTELQKVYGRNDRLEQKLLTVRDKNEKLRQKLQTLREKVEAKNEKIETLRQQRKELKNKIKNQNAEYKKLSAEYNELKNSPVIIRIINSIKKKNQT